MLTAKSITSADICKALRKKHEDDLWFEELRLSSGFQWAGRIDFYAIDPSPSGGNKASSYEIKVSRADFKRDTYEKQRGARLFADSFSYVAPAGMLKPEEIPDWAGLLEAQWYSFSGRTPYLKLVPTVPPPKRDKDSPSWGLVCSLIRNAKRQGVAR